MVAPHYEIIISKTGLFPLLVILVISSDEAAAAYRRLSRERRLPHSLFALPTTLRYATMLDYERRFKKYGILMIAHDIGQFKTVFQLVL
jgi:hypothetical protein